MSDAEEFMKVATATKSESPRPTEAPDRVITQDKKDEGREAGDFTQYYRTSYGFSVTTRTYATLPPGVYEIVATPTSYAFNPLKLVTDDLLRLPDSKSEQVIAEIADFWKRKAKFKQYGFAHKRGFLLFGPPGSGKTSTVATVSRQLVEAGGIVISGNINPQVLASLLAQLRQVEPERPLVVLLEDIDTIIYRWGEADILALLDGENSIENVVFLATTNYPENLDGRVVNRPSRFDRIVKIGMPSAEARALYLKSRKVDFDITKAVELTNDFSIAHLKELVISVCCFGNNLEEEIDRIRGMSKMPKSDDSKKKTGF